MKKMLIAGNWKMNTVIDESIELANSILKGIGRETSAVEILICPPFTSLYSVNQVIQNSPIKLGAQNCFYKPKGAFTGEISIPMLKQVGCSYIITGHSERRTIFGETNSLINNKAQAILENNLKPIICIGETLEERNQGKTFDVLENQIKECLKGITKEFCDYIVIAYEPVWAIGTGIVATTEQINEAHSFIRDELSKLYLDDSKHICIQYGGSVNDENAKEILSLKEVNGALIGGASLKADSFLNIIKTAKEFVV